MPETLTRIPIADRLGWTRFIQLPDVRIGIRTHYLARRDLYALWFLALDGTLIRGPELIVNGLDFLYGTRYDTRMPQGQLFSWSADGEPPRKATADVDAFLFYRGP